MNESYVCSRCGFVGRFVETIRNDHYKGAPPNCPSCHRPMDLFEEKDEAPATSAKPRKTA